MGNLFFRNNTDQKEQEQTLRYAIAVAVANEARTRSLLQAAEESYKLAHGSFQDAQKIRQQVSTLLQKHKLKFPSAPEFDVPDIVQLSSGETDMMEAQRLVDNARQMLRNKFTTSVLNMERTRSATASVEPSKPPTFRKSASGVFACGFNTCVKESTLPQAGKGLFAARDIGKGEVIEFFDGRLVSKSQAQSLDAQGHGSHLVALEIGGWHLDCKSTPADAVEFLLGASFANASSTHANAVIQRANDRTEPRTPFVFLVAARNIQKGEEILFNYKPH